MVNVFLLIKTLKQTNDFLLAGPKYTNHPADIVLKHGAQALGADGNTKTII